MLECTKLDTGVGAAMAAGSHELNGYCLLLVAAATSIAIRINPGPDPRIHEARAKK